MSDTIRIERFVARGLNSAGKRRMHRGRFHSYSIASRAGRVGAIVQLIQIKAQSRRRLLVQPLIRMRCDDSH